MARGRLISRTLGSSRKFAALRREAGKLGEFAQALYPLLIANSDDFGRMSGDAFTIKHAVLPTSHRREREFSCAIQAMATVGLVQLYEANGAQVIEIVDFDEHQPGLSKRTRSKFPGAPVNFTEICELPKQLKGIEQKGTEGKGREQDQDPNLPPQKARRDMRAEENRENPEGLQADRVSPTLRARQGDPPSRAVHRRRGVESAVSRQDRETGVSGAGGRVADECHDAGGAGAQVDAGATSSSDATEAREPGHLGATACVVSQNQPSSGMGHRSRSYGEVESRRRLHAIVARASSRSP